MRSKIKLNNEIHLENVGGYYYKPFNSNGREIKGILLKDCTDLYNDRNTWEMITIEKDGDLDIGPFNWNGYNTNEMGWNNFVYDFIIKLKNKNIINNKNI